MVHLHFPVSYYDVAHQEIGLLPIIPPSHQKPEEYDEIVPDKRAENTSTSRNANVFLDEKCVTHRHTFGTERGEK
jgi:hypothetical protein